jgi:hypothetical protein
MSARRPGLVLDDFGSRLYEGKRWSVLDARGPVFGPTHHRQRIANDVGQTGVCCYIEGHFNALAVKPGNKHPTQHAFAVTSARHAEDNRTRGWGVDMMARIAYAFGMPSLGVISGGAGSGNVQHVKAPALLIEPGFISDPDFRFRVSTGEGADKIGYCIAAAVMKAFPEGGIVGLSVGHRYRGNGDMGAPAAGAEDPAFDQEAELAELYLNATTEHLINVTH